MTLVCGKPVLQAAYGAGTLHQVSELRTGGEVPVR